MVYYYNLAVYYNIIIIILDTNKASITLKQVCGCYEAVIFIYKYNELVEFANCPILSLKIVSMK